MKNLIKWIKENNLNFKNVTMINGKIGIMIDTNYEGAYPSKNTYDLHSMINKKCKRLKGLKTESRGFHTGLLILEA